MKTTITQTIEAIVLGSYILLNMAGSTYAQTNPGGISLQPESEDFTILLGEEPWLYHAGDELSWSNPDFDDSDWMLLKPDFNPDSLSEGTWTGIGWFRIHLQVSEQLRNSSVTLHMFQLGASEIYLDGEKIGGFGVIGESASEEEPYSPKGFPVVLHLDEQPGHLLAIRYAHRSGDKNVNTFLGSHPRHAHGFFIIVKPANDGFQNYFYRNLAVPFAIGVVSGVFLILGIIHVLLFIWNRKERANLYFSILAFSGAFVIYVSAAYDSPGLILSDIGSYMPFQRILQCILLVSILSVYHQVIYRRLSRWYWIIAGSIIALFLILSFFPKIYNFSVVTAYLLVILEGIRITSVAIWKKKEGGWILGSGILLMLVSGLYFLAYGGESIYTDKIRLLEGGQQLALLNPSSIGIIVTYLSVPVAMSVLLAYRFSRTSHQLREELQRVQELSEKSLRQEKEKQELISQQKIRLEEQVLERTAELRKSLEDLKSAQDQLVQQEKLASLGQLTAGIAHEIKNPLNFVNNFSDLSIELVEEAREEVKEKLTADSHQLTAVFDILDDIENNLRIIHQHGTRADGIVKSMLQHSRGGSGKMEPTNVNSLIKEYANLAFHGMRAGKDPINVDLELDLDENLGEVEMIAEDFSRVILNLCNNAFDAMKEKLSENEKGKSEKSPLEGSGGAERSRGVSSPGDYEPKLTIRTHQNDQSVTIEIQDNGLGIPEEIKDKILQPFFTTKKGTAGTGLGLSITHDIVKAHGGNINITSNRNGTTISIKLNL